MRTEESIRKIIPHLVNAIQAASTMTTDEYKDYIENIVKTLQTPANKELNLLAKFAEKELQKLLPLTEKFEKAQQEVDTVRKAMLNSIDNCYLTGTF